MFISKIFAGAQALEPSGGISVLFERIGWLFTWLWEAICLGIYNLVKWLLALVDFMQYFVQKLIGLDYWLNNSNYTLEGAIDSDLIFGFLYNDTVQKVFRAMMGIFFVLLIIFTIYAIIKSEWEHINGTGKGGKFGDGTGNSKTRIFRSSIKAIALVLIFPIMLMVGILSANAILASLINALNIDTSSTLGGQLFQIASQNANKYEKYAHDTDGRTAVSDTVTFYINSGGKYVTLGGSGTSDLVLNCDTYEGYLNEIKNSTKYSVHSVFEKIGGVFDGGFDKTNWSGYVVRLTVDQQPYFILATCKAGNVTYNDKDAMYYYLKCVLQVPIVTKYDSCDFGGHKIVKEYMQSDPSWGYISNMNLNDEGFDDVAEAMHNTWNYATIYKNTYGFEEALGYTVTRKSGDSSLLATCNLGVNSAKVMYNASPYSAYFDGGERSIVQMQSEYLVMAEVIDFINQNNFRLHILNINSPLINWGGQGAYTVDSKWINTSGVEIAGQNGGKKTIPFVISYNDSCNETEMGNVLYFGDDVGDCSYIEGGSQSELDGAKYIMCIKVEGKTNAKYIPLVNNKTYVDPVTGKTYAFSSSYYSTSYQGVVLAKGLLDSGATNAYRGEPTYFVSNSENKKDKVIGTNEPYYYEMVQGGGFAMYGGYATDAKSTDLNVTLQSATISLSGSEYYYDLKRAEQVIDADTGTKGYNKEIYNVYKVSTSDDVDPASKETIVSPSSDMVQNLLITFNYKVDSQSYIVSSSYAGVTDNNYYLFTYTISGDTYYYMVYVDTSANTISVMSSIRVGGVDTWEVLGYDGYKTADNTFGESTVNHIAETKKYHIYYDYSDGIIDVYKEDLNSNGFTPDYLTYSKTSSVTTGTGDNKVTTTKAIYSTVDMESFTQGSGTNKVSKTCYFSIAFNTTSKNLVSIKDGDIKFAEIYYNDAPGWDDDTSAGMTARLNDPFVQSSSFFQFYLYDFYHAYVGSSIEKYDISKGTFSSASRPDEDDDDFYFECKIDSNGFEFGERESYLHLYDGKKYVATIYKVADGTTKITNMSDLATNTTCILYNDTTYYNIKTQNAYTDEDGAEEYFTNVKESMVISCVRDNRSLQFMDFEFYIVSIIPIKWRVKLGFFNETLEKNWTGKEFYITDGIQFDYFFEGEASLITFYIPSKISYWIIIIASALMIKVLGTAIWGVIKRIYEITLYFLAAPAVASTIPLDDGQKFTSQIQQPLVKKVLGTYGTMLGINVFFILLYPVKSLSQIFTPEEIATSDSYFLKNFFSIFGREFQAKMLNMYVYILFVLVAFTMISALPGMISSMIGAEDIHKNGEGVKKQAAGAVKEGMDFASGKNLMDAGKKVVDGAKNSLPGKAIGGVIRGARGMHDRFSKGVPDDSGGDEGKEKASSRTEEEKTEDENGVKDQFDSKFNEMAGDKFGGRSYDEVMQNGTEEEKAEAQKIMGEAKSAVGNDIAENGSVEQLEAFARIMSQKDDTASTEAETTPEETAESVAQKKFEGSVDEMAQQVVGESGDAKEMERNAVANMAGSGNAVANKVVAEALGAKAGADGTTDLTNNAFDGSPEGKERKKQAVLSTMNEEEKAKFEKMNSADQDKVLDQYDATATMDQDGKVSMAVTKARDKNGNSIQDAQAVSVGEGATNSIMQNVAQQAAKDNPSAMNNAIDNTDGAKETVTNAIAGNLANAIDFSKAGTDGQDSITEMIVNDVLDNPTDEKNGKVIDNAIYAHLQDPENKKELKNFQKLAGLSNEQMQDKDLVLKTINDLRAGGTGIDQLGLTADNYKDKMGGALQEAVTSGEFSTSAWEVFKNNDPNASEYIDQVSAENMVKNDQDKKVESEESQSVFDETVSKESEKALNGVDFGAEAKKAYEAKHGANTWDKLSADEQKSHTESKQSELTAQAEAQGRGKALFNAFAQNSANKTDEVNKMLMSATGIDSEAGQKQAIADAVKNGELAGRDVNLLKAKGYSEQDIALGVKSLGLLGKDVNKENLETYMSGQMADAGNDKLLGAMQSDTTGAVNKDKMYQMLGGNDLIDEEQKQKLTEQTLSNGMSALSEQEQDDVAERIAKEDYEAEHGAGTWDQVSDERSQLIAEAKKKTVEDKAKELYENGGAWDKAIKNGELDENGIRSNIIQAKDQLVEERAKADYEKEHGDNTWDKLGDDKKQELKKHAENKMADELARDKYEAEHGKGTWEEHVREPLRAAISQHMRNKAREDYDSQFGSGEWDKLPSVLKDLSEIRQYDKLEKEVNQKTEDDYKKAHGEDAWNNLKDDEKEKLKSQNLQSARAEIASQIPGYEKATEEIAKYMDYALYDTATDKARADFGKGAWDKDLQSGKIDSNEKQNLLSNAEQVLNKEYADSEAEIGVENPTGEMLSNIEFESRAKADYEAVHGQGSWDNVKNEREQLLSNARRKANGMSLYEVESIKNGNTQRETFDNLRAESKRQKTIDDAIAANPDISADQLMEVAGNDPEAQKYIADSLTQRATATTDEDAKDAQRQAEDEIIKSNTEEKDSKGKVTSQGADITTSKGLEDAYQKMTGLSENEAKTELDAEVNSQISANVTDKINSNKDLRKERDKWLKANPSKTQSDFVAMMVQGAESGDQATLQALGYANQNALLQTLGYADKKAFDAEKAEVTRQVVIGKAKETYDGFEADVSQSASKIVEKKNVQNLLDGKGAEMLKTAEILDSGNASGTYRKFVTEAETEYKRLYGQDANLAKVDPLARASFLTGYMNKKGFKLEADDEIKVNKAGAEAKAVAQQAGDKAAAALQQANPNATQAEIDQARQTAGLFAQVTADPAQFNEMMTVMESYDGGENGNKIAQKLKRTVMEQTYDSYQKQGIELSIAKDPETMTAKEKKRFDFNKGILQQEMRTNNDVVGNLFKNTNIFNQEGMIASIARSSGMTFDETKSSWVDQNGQVLKDDKGNNIGKDNLVALKAHLDNTAIANYMNAHEDSKDKLLNLGAQNMMLTMNKETQDIKKADAVLESSYLRNEVSTKVLKEAGNGALTDKTTGQLDKNLVKELIAEMLKANGREGEATDANIEKNFNQYKAELALHDLSKVQVTTNGHASGVGGRNADAFVKATGELEKENGGNNKFANALDKKVTSVIDPSNYDPDTSAKEFFESKSISDFRADDGSEIKNIADAIDAFHKEGFGGFKKGAKNIAGDKNGGMTSGGFVGGLKTMFVGGYGEGKDTGNIVGNNGSKGGIVGGAKTIAVDGVLGSARKLVTLKGVRAGAKAIKDKKEFARENGRDVSYVKYKAGGYELDENGKVKRDEKGNAILVKKQKLSGAEEKYAKEQYAKEQYDALNGAGEFDKLSEADKQTQIDKYSVDFDNASSTAKEGYASGFKNLGKKQKEAYAEKAVIEGRAKENFARDEFAKEQYAKEHGSLDGFDNLDATQKSQYTAGFAKLSQEDQAKYSSRFDSSTDAEKSKYLTEAGNKSISDKELENAQKGKRNKEYAGKAKRFARTANSVIDNTAVGSLLKQSALGVAKIGAGVGLGVGKIGAGAGLGVARGATKVWTSTAGKAAGAISRNHRIFKSNNNEMIQMVSEARKDKLIMREVGENASTAKIARYLDKNKTAGENMRNRVYANKARELANTDQTFAEELTKAGVDLTDDNAIAKHLNKNKKHREKVKGEIKSSQYFNEAIASNSSINNEVKSRVYSDKQIEDKLNSKINNYNVSVTEDDIARQAYKSANLRAKLGKNATLDDYKNYLNSHQKEKDLFTKKAKIQAVRENRGGVLDDMLVNNGEAKVNSNGEVELTSNVARKTFKKMSKEVKPMSNNVFGKMGGTFVRVGGKGLVSTGKGLAGMVVGKKIGDNFSGSPIKSITTAQAKESYGKNRYAMAMFARDQYIKQNGSDKNFKPHNVKQVYQYSKGFSNLSAMERLAYQSGYENLSAQEKSDYTKNFDKKKTKVNYDQVYYESLSNEDRLKLERMTLKEMTDSAGMHGKNLIAKQDILEKMVGGHDNYDKLSKADKKALEAKYNNLTVADARKLLGANAGKMDKSVAQYSRLIREGRYQGFTKSYLAKGTMAGLKGLGKGALKTITAPGRGVIKTFVGGEKDSMGKRHFEDSRIARAGKGIGNRAIVGANAVIFKTAKKLPAMCNQYVNWNKILEHKITAIKNDTKLTREQKTEQIRIFESQKIYLKKPDAYANMSADEQNAFDLAQDKLKRQAYTDSSLASFVKKMEKAEKAGNPAGVGLPGELDYVGASSKSRKEKHLEDFNKSRAVADRFRATAAMRNKERDYGDNFEKFAQGFMSRKRYVDMMKRYKLKTAIQYQMMTADQKEKERKKREQAINAQLSRINKILAKKVAKDNKVSTDSYLASRGITPEVARFKDGSFRYRDIQNAIPKTGLASRNAQVGKGARSNAEILRIQNETLNINNMMNEFIKFTSTFKGSSKEFAEQFRKEFAKFGPYAQKIYDKYNSSFKRLGKNIVGMNTSLDATPIAVQQRKIMEGLSQELSKYKRRVTMGGKIPASSDINNMFVGKTYSGATTQAELALHKQTADELSRLLKLIKDQRNHVSYASLTQRLAGVYYADFARKNPKINSLSEEAKKNKLEQYFKNQLDKALKVVHNDGAQLADKHNLEKLNGRRVKRSEIDHSKHSTTMSDAMKTQSNPVYQNLVREANSATEKHKLERGNLDELVSMLRKLQSMPRTPKNINEISKVEKAIRTSQVKLKNLKTIMDSAQKRKRDYEQSFASTQIKEAKANTRVLAYNNSTSVLDRYHFEMKGGKAVEKGSVKAKEVQMLVNKYISSYKQTIQSMINSEQIKNNQKLKSYIDGMKSKFTADFGRNMKYTRDVKDELSKYIEEIKASGDRADQSLLSTLQMFVQKFNDSNSDLEKAMANLGIDVSKIKLKK